MELLASHAHREECVISTTIQRRHWSNALRVEEDFQKRQIYRVLACALVYVALSTLLLCVFYVYMMDPSVEAASFWTALREIAASPEARGALGNLTLAWIVSMSGLSAIFAAYTGLAYSHQVAGPLHGLKRDLERIAAGRGDFDPIQLRSGDELAELVVALNRALETVRDGTSGAGASSDLRAELCKQLAALKTDELCDADAGRVDAWVDELRRVVGD